MPIKGTKALSPFPVVNGPQGRKAWGGQTLC